MDDRLTDLERLARLREAGTLSDGEFEREKSRLLDGSSVLPSTPAAAKWKMWLAAGLCVLAVVGGILIGRAIFQPKHQAANESAPAMEAVPLTRAAPVEAAAPAPTPPRPTSSPWIGEYEGSFEGNAEGTLRIEGRPNGRLHVELGIGSPRCVGGINFRTAAPSGNTLVLTKPRDDSGRRCRLALTRRGDRIMLQEQECMYYHGFECSFSGEAMR